MPQIAAELRSSAQITAGLLQRAHELRVSQQQPQQQLATPRRQDSTPDRCSGSGGGSTGTARNLGAQDACATQQAQQQLPDQQLVTSKQQQQDRQRPSSPFAVLASCQERRQEPDLAKQGSPSLSYSCRTSSCDSGPPSCSGSSQGGPAVDRQSPIFKQRRPSAAGSRSQAGAGSRAVGMVPSSRTASRSSAGGAAAAAVGSGAAAMGKAAALPPRPPRTSSSGTTPRSPRASSLGGLSPQASTSGFSLTLSPASSSTPLFASPCESRRTSSCGFEDADSSQQLEGAGGEAPDGDGGCSNSCTGAVAALACPRLASDLVQPQVVDTRVAMLSSSDQSMFTASVEAAWLKASAPDIADAADVHVSDVAAAAAGVAAVKAAVAGPAMLLSRTPLCRGVSTLSAVDGPSSRQLSTAGVSSLVAETGASLAAQSTAAEAETGNDNNGGIAMVSTVDESASSHCGGSSGSASSEEQAVWPAGHSSSRHSPQLVLAAALLPVGGAAVAAVCGGLGLLQHHRARKSKLAKGVPGITAAAAAAAQQAGRG